MLYTIFYGFSIGAILYFISIGLSLTFGTMRIVNFAHTLTYSIGVYVLITFLPWRRGASSLPRSSRSWRSSRSAT